MRWQIPQFQQFLLLRVAVKSGVIATNSFRASVITVNVRVSDKVKVRFYLKLS